jgi:16S rRNA (cytosine1402-N4)-methyltransferase
MHVSVLYDEVLEQLSPRPGGLYVDCTVNGGGHAAGILDRSSPDGRLLGLDADPSALARARERLAPFGERAELVHANFRELRGVAERHGFAPAQGVLFDLGVSSAELEESGRGFSFQRPDEPLDMRLDPTGGETAADILNSFSEAELTRLFRDFGEEYRASRLARAVAQQRRERPFRSVGDLLLASHRALGPKRGRIHPATRAFQALRIATNDELAAVDTAVRTALELLAPGGRLAVISFHSLEDRIVKYILREHAADGARPHVTLLTRKPLIPSRDEVMRNPRSRSAKLRVAQRT